MWEILFCSFFFFKLLLFYVTLFQVGVLILENQVCLKNVARNMFLPPQIL